MSHSFASVAGYPAQADGPGVLQRLFDGLGYRLYWATRDLRDEDLRWQSGAGHLTIAEQLAHLYSMINRTQSILGLPVDEQPLTDSRAQIDRLLEILAACSVAAAELPSDGLQDALIGDKPFWHAINGPLADSLTHVGQINLLRRLAGNPVSAHKPFTMAAP